ncbi:hypothetical protein L917_00270 [Phytophthora nicotianae]|uniref:Uncharacterized protein n=1 Tax=Phytophthora nicotianae TaxID=4792 RepID=W2M199_PHYNI|nr:hypothetical protein L917_00270 [Phytophthora nicotianae]
MQRASRASTPAGQRTWRSDERYPLDNILGYPSLTALTGITTCQARLFSSSVVTLMHPNGGDEALET